MRNSSRATAPQDERTSKRSFPYYPPVTHFKKRATRVDPLGETTRMHKPPERSAFTWEGLMKKLAQAALLAALSVVAASAVQAAEPVKRGGFLAQMDLDFGGDDVAT